MDALLEKVMAQIGGASANYKAYLASLVPEEWSKEAKAVPEMADIPAFMAAQKFREQPVLPPIRMFGFLATQDHQAALAGFDRVTSTPTEYARLVDETVRLVFTGELKMTKFGPENYPLRILAERVRRAMRFVIDKARAGQAFLNNSEGVTLNNFCCPQPDCPEIIFQRELMKRIVLEATGDRRCAVNVTVYVETQVDAGTEGQ